MPPPLTYPMLVPTLKCHNRSHDASSHIIEPDDYLANSVLGTSGESLEYRNLVKGPDAEVWIKALANDLG